MPIPLARTAALLLAAALFLPTVTASQDDPAAAAASAQADTDAALRAEQQSQQQRDAWETERVALEQRYRQARNDAAWLTRRVARERITLEALVDKKAELARRLIESERLTDSLEDTLSVLVDRLAATVAADLPFLGEERKQRLAFLRSELGDPDAPAADKLRRVLEAYIVEAGYGGTVEIASEPILVDGQEIWADVLRIGRLALFWRTPDTSRAGTFDQATGAWVQLDRGDHRSISRAMEMAARMRPVAVIGLPLGRIER